MRLVFWTAIAAMGFAGCQGDDASANPPEPTRVKATSADPMPNPLESRDPEIYRAAADAEVTRRLEQLANTPDRIALKRMVYSSVILDYDPDNETALAAIKTDNALYQSQRVPEDKCSDNRDANAILAARAALRSDLAQFEAVKIDPDKSHQVETASPCRYVVSGDVTVWSADRHNSFWKYRVVLTGTETGFDVVSAQAYDTPF